mgnify:CR=1 FL=1
MREFYKNYLKDNTFFWVFSIIGLLLIIIAFFIPPAAYIDSSVLIAVGEINGFAALGAVIKAIDNGGSATFHHNNTELTITSDEDDKEEEDE